MKIKLSHLVFTGISLAGIFTCEAGITLLNANGSWSITDPNTGGQKLLNIPGLIKTDNFSSTNDGIFNGVIIGKGNGSLNYNTALGTEVLKGVSPTGICATGVGSYALQNNSSGSSNTAIGHAALNQNTVGAENTALGAGALRNNTNGSENTALGIQSLTNNQSSWNTAIGKNALYHNTLGHSNIAIGWGAASSQKDGTALTTSSGGIYIGAFCRGKSNSDMNSIVIGTGAFGEGANTTVIGTVSTVSTHLYGKTISDSLKVDGSTILNGGATVNGATILNGKVTLSQAQVDIGMGIFN
jgi:hypothetical protein